MSLDIYLYEVSEHCVHDANITHNLSGMAGKAGIYKHLWAPEEIGITRAGDLLEPLKEGLAKLKADPDHFKQFEPSNGWGTYEGLVRFVEEYIEAIEAHPEARISASR